jgi:sec-independent protein translocase protein TatA
MGNFGIQEIVIIVVIIALLFGSSRLPSIARGTGKHLRKTKDSVGTFKDEFESGMREIDPVSPIKETMKNAEAGKATTPRRPRIPRRIAA